MKNTRWIPVAAGLVLLLATPLAVAGQEHPTGGQEHPTGEQEHPEEGQEHPEEGQEHPEEGHEHPEEAGQAELTKEQLGDAIEAHIARETEDTDGVYMLDDPETGETLHLELEKVHEERLSRVGEDTYFACVDFVAQDGTTYDVDFFMEGTHADDLEYQEFSIHKVNGVERYTWYEEDGVWKKRPVAEGGY